MSEKLYTIAILKAKDDKLDEMLAVLEELARHTRQEVGALQYGFYRSQEAPNIVLSFEEWQDADAEDKHWKTPHLTSAIEAFKDILDGDPIVYKGPQII
ncbi:MAG: putative quinol monooxygenase [Cyanobacteria bacterium J06633_2]